MLHLSSGLTIREGYYGYKAEDIVMLTDDSRDPRHMPTRENIVCLFHFPR